jgi:starch-binding outer membrane protein, SusD/RagB family
MKIFNQYKRVSKLNDINRLGWAFMIVTCLTASCKKSLEVDLPKSLIPIDIVFSDDVTATAAVTGIYAGMVNSEAFASGTNQSITALAGLSADELVDYPGIDQFSIQFEENELTTVNYYIETLWSTMYKSIYQANAVLEGLSASTGVSPSMKDQLEGEALFIRAFSHFYLVNLFGDVPLITATDYKVNSTVSRTAVSKVYDQIKQDLVTAIELLSDAYVTTISGERVRPNKASASALLARVYLYLQDWANAEAQATILIEAGSMYNLESDLNAVFLKNSNEAIWQLRAPVSDGWGRAFEAAYFGTHFLDFNILNSQLVGAFEVNDSRQTNWLGSFDTGSEIIYHPFKYKQLNQDAPPEEYSIVLRLAEQYLIRAEARAKQNDLSGAISDVDAIRSRAGLPLILDTEPGINQADLLTVIMHERQIELFSEWGHRWFDLKRWNKSTEVLGPLKTGWVTNDMLYPIPQSEINKNPNLKPQNPGY